MLEPFGPQGASNLHHKGDKTTGPHPDLPGSQARFEAPEIRKNAMDF